MDNTINPFNSDASLTNQEGSAVNRKLAVRWGGNEDFFSDSRGWVGVPDVFLRLYSKLEPTGGISVAEAMFVLQLMAFKWSKDAPYPSYSTLAKKMGVSDKMVRRYAASLESKGFLKRHSRIGSSNSFDLSPLFVALQAAHIKERGRVN